MQKKILLGLVSLVTVLIIGYAFAASDADFDGIIDPSDNCVFVANPDQADNDSNGVGDVCE